MVSRLPLPAQRARRDALHAIGRTRRLTPDEHREADGLDHRAYMRAWRSNNAAALR